MEDPAGSISFHQESHLKGRSGNEDYVGMCHPCQAGLAPTDGCFSPWAVRLSCLFQNQFTSFSTLVSFSAEVRKANIWGSKGELAGPRAGGRLAPGGRRGPRGWTALQAGPGPQRGHLLPTLPL